MQRDPDKDGINLYGYCGSNSISIIDPSGLKSVYICWRSIYFPYNKEKKIYIPQIGATHPFIVIDGIAIGYAPTRGVDTYGTDSTIFNNKVTRDTNCYELKLSTCEANCLKKHANSSAGGQKWLRNDRFWSKDNDKYDVLNHNCHDWLNAVFRSCGIEVPYFIPGHFTPKLPTPPEYPGSNLF